MPSETEAGEEDEVDVCAVERIPALCSRYKAQTTLLHCNLVALSYNKAENDPLLFTQPDANTQRDCENLMNFCKSSPAARLLFRFVSAILVNISAFLVECLA